MADAYESFVVGYITCALWSSNDDDENPLDDNYDAGDLSADAEATMRADCAAFMAQNRADLDAYAELREYSPSDGDVWEHAGHDFWLTRNGHGAGFWDRGLGALGDRLTEAAHAFGTCDLMVCGTELDTFPVTSTYQEVMSRRIQQAEDSGHLYDPTES